jgi:hypothetical protein
VKIIEFTDWNTPNAALANKDIDVNYFQHIPFLENAKKQGGYNFVAIAPGTIMKIGLYSKKIKRFDELKDGATVAIANDPVNGGRGLLLLQRAGLIKLKPGIDYRATTLDITDNPKHLKIVQLEASQLASRSISIRLRCAPRSTRPSAISTPSPGNAHRHAWTVRRRRSRAGAAQEAVQGRACPAVRRACRRTASARDTNRCAGHCESLKGAKSWAIFSTRRSSSKTRRLSLCMRVRTQRRRNPP